MSDHYATLGVPRDATQEQVRVAFVEFSSCEHPDLLPPHASAAVRAARTARFAAVSEAYAVLRDEGRRAEYDRTGGPADPVELLAYSGEVAATIGALRGAGEPIGAFAQRMAVNAFGDLCRAAQTPDGKRQILAHLSRFARPPDRT